MLPVVGIVLLIQPALCLTALGGAMALGGLTYVFHFYWAKANDKFCSRWFLLLYVVAYFVISLIAFAVVADVSVLRFEYIESMSYAK